jgi:hypothetical protein
MGEKELSEKAELLARRLDSMLTVKFTDVLAGKKSDLTIDDMMALILPVLKEVHGS